MAKVIGIALTNLQFNILMSKFALIHDEVFLTDDTNEEYPTKVFYNKLFKVYKTENSKGVKHWKPKPMTDSDTENLKNWTVDGEISPIDIFMAGYVEEYSLK